VLLSNPLTPHETDMDWLEIFLSSPTFQTIFMYFLLYNNLIIAIDVYPAHVYTEKCPVSKNQTYKK
jgi:hypothetical protein